MVRFLNSFFHVIRQVEKLLVRPSPGACSGPVNCKISYVFFYISKYEND